MSWILFELARHPKIQSRLRDEIRNTEAIVCARGDSLLKVQDLEAMPYLDAVIKVGVFRHMCVSIHLISSRKDYGSTPQRHNHFESLFKMTSFHSPSQFSLNLVICSTRYIFPKAPKL